jgi:glycine/D-amino acid oxidase-like deaminating enzyme
MEKLDTVVVGAGVIGLSCARALAQAGRQVWLLERAEAGEVIGIAVAAVNAKGSASYSVGGMIGAYGLLGALDMAKAHMITYMMESEE